MRKEPRKSERLVSQEEKVRRHVKHPVSTEPATHETGIPMIPARGPVRKGKSGAIPSTPEESGGNSRE
jgi:hypothetical protein